MAFSRSSEGGSPSNCQPRNNRHVLIRPTHSFSASLVLLLVVSACLFGAFLPTPGETAGASKRAMVAVAAHRFLPRSPGKGGLMNRQRLDALLNAELAALEKKLVEEEEQLYGKEAAAEQRVEQKGDHGSEKPSRKRDGEGDDEDPTAAADVSGAGRSNGLKDTVARLVDQIEKSKLKEAVLEEKLNKLEVRLEEESLAKALLLAKVPALFGNDRTGSTLIELVNDDEPLITKGDVTDFCHFNSLKFCGYKALEALGKMDAPLPADASSSSPVVFQEKPTANELPIWERCQIKDEFLTCMISRKHVPCEPGSKATLSRKALHEFRRVLMKALQQARGCWLPK